MYYIGTLGALELLLFKEGGEGGLYIVLEWIAMVSLELAL